MAWDRIEPVRACTSPDGHDYVDVMNFGSTVPERVVCPRCGEPWQVAVMPAPQ